MCRPATCRRCGKASYAGCGRHVEQVLANVPPAQRCTCRTDPPAKTGRKPLLRRFGGA